MRPNHSHRRSPIRPPSPRGRHTAFQAAYRGYRLRHRLRRLPAREAERTIRALHANAHGFRRIALFLVFAGLFFSIVFSSADVEFQRTVHQGLENHLSMVRAVSVNGHARSCVGGVVSGYRAIDEIVGHDHVPIGSFVVMVLQLLLMQFLWRRVCH